MCEAVQSGANSVCVCAEGCFDAWFYLCALEGMLAVRQNCGVVDQYSAMQGVSRVHLVRVQSRQGVCGGSCGRQVHTAAVRMVGCTCMHAAHTQPIAHSRLTRCLSHTPAPLLQQDGFADDTVRMIKQLRTANPAIQVRCDIGGATPREGGQCWAGLGRQSS